MSAEINIERRPLSDLNPADYNPRMISPEAYAGLKSSIERFGLVQPIVWNRRTGNVVSGHQRLSVLLEGGETETDVVVVDLDDVEEKALNVTQNNDNITGSFTEGLDELLAEISEGIGDAAMGDLRLGELAPPEIPDFEPLDDSEAPPPIEPKKHRCPNCGAEW